jgi:hypothetical protein
VEIADGDAGENASFQSAIDPQIFDRGIMVDVMTGDREKRLADGRSG